MKLRRLHEQGIRQFGEFLDSLTTEHPQQYPEELLTSEESTEVIEPEVELEKEEFCSRHDAAAYLNNVFSDAGLEGVDRDQGLWAWLALFYFNQLCPVSDNGERKPGERARWIPAVGDFRKYYRHLLAGPFRIYRAHRDAPERALVLLCTPLHQPGDIVEQLASRQELVTNVAIISAATELYVDADTRMAKRGAAGRGPGSARRLAEVLNQFDLNWDLYSMSTEAILDVLPNEFSRFRLDDETE